MQYIDVTKWGRRASWLLGCLMVPLLALSGQFFQETLEVGQTIKIEWVQQQLLAASINSPSPALRSVDELAAGETELRVGMTLQSVGTSGELSASIEYISYLEIPVRKSSTEPPGPLPLLTEPIILDTRYQDKYFDPRLFLLAELTKQTLPIDCDVEGIRLLFDDFRQRANASAKASHLLEEQRTWLAETPLPQALSAQSMADMFCLLLPQAVPVGEYPVFLGATEKDSLLQTNYVKVDHPTRECIIAGKINAPVTEELTMSFFREGSWLMFWRDSLLQLADDGSFHFAFSLDHPRIVSLRHGYQVMRLYVEPGDTIQLTTNGNAFFQGATMKGPGQEENAFLQDFYHEMRGDTMFRRFDYSLLEQDHTSFFKKVQAKEMCELSYLKQRTHVLRPGFAGLLQQKLKLEHANTQWGAAYQFMVGKQIVFEPELLHHLQGLSRLLYRLPQGKSFDFDVEDYLVFQYYFLRQGYQEANFGRREDIALAALLPGKETSVRHQVMQLFRTYSELGKLTESGKQQLEELMAVVRDTQLLDEMSVLGEGKQQLPEAVAIRTLRKGDLAPSWSLSSREGAEVKLESFLGTDLLLHIGWVDNLDMAMSDIQYLRTGNGRLPEIVHLVVAPDEDSFDRETSGRDGVFVFVSPEEMQGLRASYYIDNRSNHYFLIGEDGRILANHYDLGTAKKLRGAWGGLAKEGEVSTWSAEEKLLFWRTLGISVLCLLLVSALFVWRRRIAEKREERKRQLLEVELRGIRSQMNPHFLFNAMSAIQNLIRKKEQEKADIYLGEFAGLMRKTLRNTAEAYIPLTDEIETLRQYCSLESLRHPFSYTFEVDDSIDIYNTYVPSMILQPIVENAILHGLSPQTGAKSLVVKVLPGEEGLLCTVSDNGIGIIAARQQRQEDGHQSVGMKLIRQRLALMGLRANEHFTIADRSTLTPGTQGTIVSLTIPVEK